MLYKLSLCLFITRVFSYTGEVPDMDIHKRKRGKLIKTMKPILHIDKGFTERLYIQLH